MAGNDWTVKTFGECAQLIRESVRPEEVVGMPYIGLEHILEGQLRLDSIGIADQVTSLKSRFQTGDILFGKLRPYFRKLIIAPFDGVCSTDIWVVRSKTGIFQRFLFYWMASYAFIEESTRASEGTKMPRAQWGFVSRIKKSIPPLHEQRAIACILGALDDKIELNRRMNETLEQIAQAIFKKWFIEPTKNARQKDGGQGLPEGWREDSIYLAADVIYGAPFSSAKFNTKKIGKPLIRIRNLANESPDVFTPEIHPKGYLVKPGDIVVGMDGEFRAYIWGGEKSWLNQRLCVFIPKPGFSAPYVLYSITRPLAEVEATETATTVIHLGKNDIDRFKIIIAPDKILASFNRIAEPLFKRIVLNKQKSRTLAALRDSLLPKLISGELRVPDAEKICARGASALGGMEKCS